MAATKPHDVATCDVAGCPDCFREYLDSVMQEREAKLAPEPRFMLVKLVAAWVCLVWFMATSLGIAAALAVANYRFWLRLLGN
jgi:hypothetical protein